MPLNWTLTVFFCCRPPDWRQKMPFNKKRNAFVEDVAVAEEGPLQGELEAGVVVELEDGGEAGVVDVEEDVLVLGLVVDVLAAEDEYLDGVEDDALLLLEEAVLVELVLDDL